ncbi:hypothetical protein [Levilactobacillus phage ENFP1]|nr:hypothetical protein [Levilactobacillus phage ENFP1]
MVKESNLETTPGLIVLIDNPTEEDLLRVIYSDKVESDVIKEIPDNSITSKVATIALCLNKTWRYQELVIWFNKFIPHVNPKDYLKVFINIEDKLPLIPESFYDKNYYLFIGLFSKINNPTTELIDFYLKICIKNNLLGIEERHYKRPKDTYIWDTYSFRTTFLTRNLKGILNKSQKKLIDSYIGYPNIHNKDGFRSIAPDLDALLEGNNIALKQLSYFISKESCDELSRDLYELNKPSLDHEKELLENSKEDIPKESTPKEDKEVSLWERFLRVFK